MAPVEISIVIALMVTVNIWPIVNVFIILMKIKSLVFMANPVSSSKILSYLLGASLGFINQSLNHSKYFAPKSDPSQYQYDDTPTP